MIKLTIAAETITLQKIIIHYYDSTWSAQISDHTLHPFFNHKMDNNRNGGVLKIVILSGDCM